jgi:phosphoribosyl-ATP pyrophosphohydrolase/phosphoribosyl-AMP cyclohydrolase
MLGFMNEAALEKTLETGNVTFFSRTKNRLWTKGETSGNALRVKAVQVDCDCDTLLIKAEALGPTCHRGTSTCFEKERPKKGNPLSFLGELDRLIDTRYRERPAGSYTTRLFSEGVDRMAQKVGEEAVEVVIASKNEDPALFLGEAADLVFHLMVLLRARNLSLEEVASCLRRRHVAK